MEPSGSGAAAEWDARLGEWPAANLLQTYAWGEVQSRSGWTTHRLLVPTAAGPLPVSAQVTKAGLPGFTRIYVPRGPCCPASDQDTFRTVLAALVDLGRRCRALALEIEVSWRADEVPAGHPWLSWSPARARQPTATVNIDLQPEPELILSQFHSKARYNVGLAQRRGVVINEQATVADLFRCITVTEGRHRIHLPGLRHLEALMELLGSSAWILAAEVEDEVVAAILVASFHGQATYLYGGSNGHHRDRMPNHLLQWSAMLRAREEGCHHYDLWGIPENDDPHHPWRGLAQFKLGFGGEQVRYAGSRLLQLRPSGATILAVSDAIRHQVRTRGRR
ncbi:MAG TPA: peptidoglycan bridge formation glycyltransferase FemA/FemB family protein [Candidatus Micrarchaeaceae archaeon]|nr:peptidoglycan bridge formation glycyltransferase FemA/FemB family protein [Candidatus Micrarchaeaceae archaeon]